MKKLNDLTFLFLVFVISFLYGAGENSDGIPTPEQAQRLLAAAWREPVEKIDILFYEEYTGVPKSVEEIREEVENYPIYKRDAEENLTPYELKKREESIETNVKIRLEGQKFPLRMKKRVRVFGDKQRTDFVKFGPNEFLDINAPFVHTFINTKDVNTGDFVSYHYASDMKTVFVDTTKWTKENIVQFAGIPLATASALQFILGTNQGGPTTPVYVPEPNKIDELVSTGLVHFELAYGGKKASGVNKVSIHSDPNAPALRDIISIGDPNNFPLVVLTCDKYDYSRVYRAEAYMPTKNRITYIRECSDFDSEGFPHYVVETRYDIDGNFLEKSVYKVIEVKLNPSISDEIFELRPPANYEVDDRRPPDKRPKNVSYLTTEEVKEALKQVDKAYREKNLATLKEFLRHRSWRVRSSALGFITGVAGKEELQEIVKSVCNDEDDEVRKKAELILERLQK